MECKQVHKSEMSLVPVPPYGYHRGPYMVRQGWAFQTDSASEVGWRQWAEHWILDAALDL